MEDRQLRLLGILLLVAAVLGALLSLWKGSDDSDWDAEATEPVWSVQADDVVRIDLTNGEAHLVFDRLEGEWVLSEPGPHAADPARVEGLLDELGRIEKGVPIPDADPAEFGLGEVPTARVVLTLDDDSERELVIGDKAPVGSRIYVRSAAGGVAAIGSMLDYYLEGDEEHYRDHTLVRFEIPEVRAITIEGPEGTLALSGQGKEWWLEGFTRASYDAVRELMNSLLALRFETFQEIEGIPEDPQFTVTVDEEDGTSHRVWVDRDTPLGVKVLVEGGATGFVAPGPLTFLRQGPRDVGDLAAFPIDLDDLVRVEVDLGGARWALERAEDGWTRDGEPEARADDALTLLQAASIRYRAEPVPAPIESWGLVTLHHEDQRPKVVEIGQLEGVQWRVARDQAGGEPYLVPNGALELVGAAFDEPEPADVPEPADDEPADEAPEPADEAPEPTAP